MRNSTWILVVLRTKTPVDSSQVVIAGAAVALTKDIILNVVGPTADKMGKDLAGAYEKVGRFFRRAGDKLGERTEAIGGIHPRIVRKSIQCGCDFNDPIAVEYFGGILASALFHH